MHVQIYVYIYYIYIYVQSLGLHQDWQIFIVVVYHIVSLCLPDSVNLSFPNGEPAWTTFSTAPFTVKNENCGGGRWASPCDQIHFWSPVLSYFGIDRIDTACNLHCPSLQQTHLTRRRSCQDEALESHSDRVKNVFEMHLKIK